MPCLFWTWLHDYRFFYSMATNQQWHFVYIIIIVHLKKRLGLLFSHCVQQTEMCCEIFNKIKNLLKTKYLVEHFHFH